MLPLRPVVIDHKTHTVTASLQCCPANTPDTLTEREYFQLCANVLQTVAALKQHRDNLRGFTATQQTPDLHPMLG